MIQQRQPSAVSYIFFIKLMQNLDRKSRSKNDKRLS